MTDLDARADRVRQIAETLFGKALDRGVEHIEELVDDEVHERDIDVMIIEVPADLLGAAGSMLGQGGFIYSIGKQSTRMEHQRIVTMQGAIVIGDDEVLTAFYAVHVDLQPHVVAVETMPHAAAIAATRPVKPAGG